MHDVVLNIKTYNERLLQIEETQSMYLNSLKEYWLADIQECSE